MRVLKKVVATNGHIRRPDSSLVLQTKIDVDVERRAFTLSGVTRCEWKRMLLHMEMNCDGKVDGEKKTLSDTMEPPARHGQAAGLWLEWDFMASVLFLF